MSVLAGLLGIGRRFHAQTFTSTIVVRRAGPPARNEQTGQLTPTWTVIYTGPGELKFPESQGRNVDAAGQRVVEQSPIAKFPITGEHAAEAAQIRVDDVGEIVENENDPTTVGTRFRVDGQHEQSNATARRLPVEVISYA